MRALACWRRSPPRALRAPLPRRHAQGRVLPCARTGMRSARHAAFGRRHAIGRAAHRDPELYSVPDVHLGGRVRAALADHGPATLPIRATAKAVRCAIPVCARPPCSEQRRNGHMELGVRWAPGATRKNMRHSSGEIVSLANSSVCGVHATCLGSQALRQSSGG